MGKSDLQGLQWSSEEDVEIIVGPDGLAKDADAPQCCLNKESLHLNGGIEEQTWDVYTMVLLSLMSLVVRLVVHDYYPGRPPKKAIMYAHIEKKKNHYYLIPQLGNFTRIRVLISLIA